MRYLDSETCGKTGPMVLLQYAVNNGPIHLHHIWESRIAETLDLIEDIVSDDVCIFNAIFDWFHLNKIYNCLRVLYDNGYTDVPTIPTMIEIEQHNPSTYCLRPKSCIDLMLYARKGPYQMVMNRKPIRIRKVPLQIAEQLAEELKNRIDLPKICFTKRPYKWDITNVTDTTADLKLTFGGSSSLRALAAEVLGKVKPDFPIPASIMPTEYDWYPYGQQGSRPWGRMISSHIALWNRSIPQQYAREDIELLRDLHKAWNSPSGGDVDSELACSLGAARWRGFSMFQEKLTELESKFAATAKKAPRSPRLVKEYISETLTDIEKAVFTSTKKTVLEALAKTGNVRAQNVLDARMAKLRHTLVKKLQRLPSYHPDFKIIGTKSNRMGGGSEDKTKGGGINPQGIPRDPEFRSVFTLTYPGEVLEGGDAKSFEVTILDAVCNCPTLRKELLAGKNFHGLMGEMWYGITYEEVMNSKKVVEGYYDRSKKADFAWFYQAQNPKLAGVLNMFEEQVESAVSKMKEKYPEVIERRESVALSFCSMRQPGGLGTQVEWHDPAEYIESIFGFRRYFTLENSIVKALYNFAEKPPKWLTSIKDKVVRNNGVQTVGGATRSALFGAAFNIQQSNMRAACNHEIQSPGGEITKRLQLKVWQQQPVGISAWVIRSLNIHDELLVVHNGTVDCGKLVKDFVTEYRSYIPCLGWDWKPMKSWGDK